MALAKKLNVKDGTKVRVVGKPANVDLDDIAATTSTKAEAVMVFAKTLAEVDAKAGPVVAAAKQDALAWLAYPKAGKLGTDLNRDILWQHMLQQGIQAVRQVSVDDTWSALRFRPGK
jgi:hypothetical protein